MELSEVNGWQDRHAVQIRIWPADPSKLKLVTSCGTLSQNYSTVVKLNRKYGKRELLHEDDFEKVS